MEKEPLNLKLSKSTLVDISSTKAADLELSLDQVGMSGVQMPLFLKNEEGLIQVPALADVFVSLDDTKAKGIHMSRLYGLLKEKMTAEEGFQLKDLQRLGQELIESQKGLSGTSWVRLNFDLPFKRRALVSGLEGWRQYPLRLEALSEASKFIFRFGFEVLYSSTCPCSAALSEQETLQSFEAKGQWQGITATAHSQRSRARVWLEAPMPVHLGDLMSFVDEAEARLGTPVQSAVKRSDELAFAKLNAENLMFCEDAGRKLKAWLEEKSEVTDYWIEVSHEESLHPHNARARAVKGRPQGFRINQEF